MTKLTSTSWPKKKEGKGKGPAVGAKGKGKAKVATKGKSFLCNVDEDYKRNYLKYLTEKKMKKKEASSFKQLEEGELTFKVGMGDVISARAVGHA
ncbi:gag/pol protein [Cucumis melo var. makuwa]|uniref:Gag/pol protein n=1 Tax=Cucumis melo var. makuwa TaxID=1194695 RepID=A0A5D3D8C6_CUCMM|nr:gag/pol protein [Cucumis melo var. makuwa]